MTRGSFYKSARWKRMRRAILSRDKYRDQLAARYGKNIEANTVHHILPREDYPQYQLKPWNLISLSHETHNTLHDRATGKLTEEGQRLAERTARRQGIKLNGNDDN